MASKPGCAGTIVVVGFAASILTFFQFATGVQSINQILDGRSQNLEYKPRQTSVRRSSISDYRVFAHDGDEGRARFRAIGAKPSGLFRNKETLVLLDCDDSSCSESSLFKTETDETIVNGASDRSGQHVIAFTGARVVYVNLANRLFTAFDYETSCAWNRNPLEAEPTERMFEQISLSPSGTRMIVTFKFSGWTCHRLRIGDGALILRHPPGLEYNRFKSYRIEMTIDRLGLLKLISAAPL